ncbi:MAG: glutathione S-transferase family protein [Paracoccaceae bacterium]
MTPTLHFHPFSSFCQKVLIALYDTDIEFRPNVVDLGDPDQRAALARLWPMVRFPVLEVGPRAVPETSVIIEYLADTFAQARRLIPAETAAEVRLWDRLFDLYVQLPMQKIVLDHLRPADARDPYGVAEARAALRRFYPVAEARLEGRPWAAGDFSMADCAAAPALYYANRVEPWGAAFPALSGYYDRLAARPSYARVLDEAAPWSHFFPVPGA